MRQRSIALRLAVGLAVGMAVLWLGAAAISVAVMQQKLLEVYDESLQQNAFGLLPLAVHELQEGDDEAAAFIVGRRREAARRADDDRERRLVEHDPSFAYVVRNPSGKTVLRDERAPEALDGLAVEDGFGELDGQRRFVLTDADTGYSIVVLETSDRREVAFRDSLAVLVLPLLALAPLIVAGVWLAMRQALRPLERLRRDISERDSRNLAPVDARDHPVELAPIAAAMDALLVRLKTALEAERAFAARSAHELRTPLAGALAQVQQLATELDDPRARSRLAQVETSLGRLSRLSEKLLQLSRVEAGFARTEVAADQMPVLAMAVRDFNASSAWQDRVILETNRLPRLEVPFDADAFAIVLRNLIENALKHGEPGRPVRVVVSPDGASVRILNEGPIVSEAEIARLGKPFARGDTVADGSGLGLSIVRSIVEQAGCTLTLRSPAEGQGAGFEAAIDLRKKPDAGRPGVTAARAGSA